MKQLLYFRADFLKESDIFNKQTIRVDNTHSAQFIGDTGVYDLVFYPDESLISIVFPNREIKYYRISTLSPKNDSSNPLAEYEDGKVISWVRHVIYSHEYNSTANVDDYQLESDGNEVGSYSYIFNDGNYSAKYTISKDGTIILTFPERSLVGTPDEIFTDDEMGNLNSIFGGKLLNALKKDYESATGRKF
ncbi:MAG: hypothetical protein JNL24_09250 [Bacteroidia bacterium]|nr:hypothetical protein [Bacteroidia bacterium]